MATKKPDLKALLSQLSTDELIAIIEEQANQDKQFSKALSLKLSPASGKGAISEARETIRGAYKGLVARGDYVRASQARYAVSGAVMVNDKVSALIQSKSYLEAIELAYVVIEETLRMFQMVDDSNGDLGDVIRETLAMVHEISQSDIHPETLNEQVFMALLKGIKIKGIDGFSDWSTDILEAASNCVTTEKMMATLEHEMNTLISQQEEGWSRDYCEEECILIKLSILQRVNNQPAIDSLINSHLQFSKIRELAISMAVEAKNYTKALEFLYDGIEINKQYPGRQHSLRILEAMIHLEMGDVEKLRSLAFNLLLKGETKVIEAYRNSFQVSEWPKAYGDILDQLNLNDYSARELYLKLVLEHQDKPRILHFLKCEPQYIPSLSEHVMPEYAEDIYATYVDHIGRNSESVNARSGYKRIRNMLLELAEIGGISHAKALTEKLISQNARRPAMIDELETVLGKLKKR